LSIIASPQLSPTSASTQGQDSNSDNETAYGANIFHSTGYGTAKKQSRHENSTTTAVEASGTGELHDNPSPQTDTIIPPSRGGD